MKRFQMDMDELSYECAIKKAQLVERNPIPNGVELLDPRRVSRHTEIDIISLATQIQNADKMIKTNACQKLCVILDQIKMLQNQAVDILKEVEKNKMLHGAACNFAKKPGHVYHLYQRSTGQNYFSMISPQEWNGTVDQSYLGSFRLEYDLSWTPLDKIEERDNKLKLAETYLKVSPNAETQPLLLKELES